MIRALVGKGPFGALAHRGQGTAIHMEVVSAPCRDEVWFLPVRRVKREDGVGRSKPNLGPVLHNHAQVFLFKLCDLVCVWLWFCQIIKLYGIKNDLLQVISKGNGGLRIE